MMAQSNRLKMINHNDVTMERGSYCLDLRFIMDQAKLIWLSGRKSQSAVERI